MTIDIDLGENYQTLSDWAIKHRAVSNREVICFKPFARCWQSRNHLFLRKAVKVRTEITGPGDPIIEHYYFSPKQYTKWLLLNS